MIFEIETNRDDVRCAGVVEESTDVAVEVCVDAVLQVKMEIIIGKH